MTKEENRKLCEKYPFLKLTFNPYTGKILEDYDYEWTWADDFPEGWYKAFGEMMLDEIKACLDKEEYADKFEILQIKEKYGALRFYHGGAPTMIYDELTNIISKYEKLSEHICINCGRPDVKHTTSGWITPICFGCYKKTYRIKDMPEEKARMLYENDTNGSSEKMPESAMWRVYYPGNGSETKKISFKDIAEKIREKWAQEDQS